MWSCAEILIGEGETEIGTSIDQTMMIKDDGVSSLWTVTTCMWFFFDLFSKSDACI